MSPETVATSPETDREDRFRQLVDAIPDIIYKLDDRGRFTFLNKAIRNLGYTPEELIGKHFTEIVHPEDVESVSRDKVLPRYTGKSTGDSAAPKLFDERRTGNRMTRNLEVRLVPRNKSEVVLGSVYSYGEIISCGEYDGDVLQPTKTLVGTVGIIRDTSERKAMQDRERKLQSELIHAEKLRTLGEILSSAAHELNNPLTSILGYAQLMLGETDLEKNRNDLNLICDEARRCSEIVQNLVAFARRKGPNRQPCDINAVVADTIRLRQYHMNVENISTDIVLDPNVPRIMADAGHLQQVFLNVLNNALHAMRKSKDRTLFVQTLAVGDAVRIRFEDSGCGIPPENLKKIFQPFFTTKGPGEGTGLGLSVCFGLINEHGGRIWAENIPAGGLAMTMELPVVPPPVSFDYAQMEHPAAVKLSGRPGVLIVDDEEHCRAVLDRYLARIGMEPHAVSSVDEAIQILRRHPIRIVVSDHKMPVKTGDALFEHIRANHPELVPFFILVTGDVLNEKSSGFIEKSKVRVVEKPFELEKLGGLISELLTAKNS